MPEVCGVSHPDHPERTCLKAPGWHANHSAGTDLAWEAAGVREEVVHTVATRPGATPQQIRDGVRQIAEGVREGQRSAGEQAAVEGMGLAHEAASESFKTEAMQAFSFLADHRAEFTVDEVWEYLRLAGTDVEAEPHKAAMGHLVRRAVRAGLIEDSGESRKSGDRASQHARKVTLWRSLKHGVVTTQVLRHTGPTS